MSWNWTLYSSTYLDLGVIWEAFELMLTLRFFLILINESQDPI